MDPGNMPWIEDIMLWNEKIMVTTHGPCSSAQRAAASGASPKLLTGELSYPNVPCEPRQEIETWNFGRFTSSHSLTWLQDSPKSKAALFFLMICIQAFVKNSH